MSYSRVEDRISLEVTVEDYENLLILLGAGIATLHEYGSPGHWRAFALVNRLNAGNPGFVEYKIPAEYRQ